MSRDVCAEVMQEKSFFRWGNCVRVEEVDCGGCAGGGDDVEGEGELTLVAQGEEGVVGDAQDGPAVVTFDGFCFCFGGC